MAIRLMLAGQAPFAHHQIAEHQVAEAVHRKGVAETEDVPHLVQVEAHDQPHRVLPAPHRGVDPHRQQHRRQRAELGEAEQHELELPEQEQDRELALEQDRHERGENRADRTAAGCLLGPLRALGERRGGVRLGRGGGTHAVDFASERLDVIANRLVLRGPVRHKLERTSPLDQRRRRVARGASRLRPGHDRPQLVAVDQTPARRAREQARRELGAAGRARGGCEGGDHGRTKSRARAIR